MTAHAPSSWIPSVPLEPPPASILDADGSPQHGTFAGPLGRVSFDHLRTPPLYRHPWRIAHHKKWLYTLVVSRSFLIAVAVVDLGYIANAFITVVDRRTRSPVFDGSFLSLPRYVQVGDVCEEGCDVWFRSPLARIGITRPAGSSDYTLAADASHLSLRVTLSTKGSAIPLVVVSPVPDGALNVTEKRVLMPARGAMLLRGNHERLDDALAGIDYTNGLLARHTSWRWAFALGDAIDGRPLALNMVDGFNEGRECAVWLDGRLVPTEGAHFEFQRSHLLSPWRLSTTDGSLDLTFRPDAMHAEHKNLGIVRSRFAQPLGVFDGTIRLPGQPTATLRAVPGVVESQDVLW